MLHRQKQHIYLLLSLFVVLLVGVSRSTISAQAAQGPCPGFDPILAVGSAGVVREGPSNNVRPQPSLSSAEIGELSAGKTFRVLDGPVCADGYTWWYVDAATIQGWTAAGTPDDYFLDTLTSRQPNDQATPQNAQPLESGGETNVAFILDASGSMRAALPTGERRIDAAQNALRNLSTQLPPVINASLWTFGHRVGNSEAEKAQSCQDIEQLVPLGPVNIAQFQDAADDVTARGWTPLSSTIQQAANTLPPGSDNSIVVISDGEETCGGNPCAVAQALHNSNIELVVNTIGFDVDATTREQLQCIARISQGQYYDASDSSELNLALEQASAPNATVQLLAPDGTPLDVYYTLTAADTNALIAEGPGPSRVPAGRYVIQVEGYTPQTINVESGQTVNITLEPIQPTATLTPMPTATPTPPPDGVFRAVDSSGQVLPDVGFELENTATLDNFSGNGTITVPPGAYRGRIRVPLADGVTQGIGIQSVPGEGTIEAGQTIDVNIDSFFGNPVTFHVADGVGNLLPDAQISLSGQYCIGDPFATFTGEAVRFRTTNGSQRLCLTVTANGETFRSHTVTNLDINALSENIQTLTVYDGLTFRTAGAEPPGIGRVQAVAPSGEPYPNARAPFIIPTNMNQVVWWRSPDSTVNTFFYAVPGEVDVSLGGTARSYLTTVTVEGGQVTLVAIAQDTNGNYVAPEETEGQAEADTSQDAGVIFFDDFESAGVSELQRGYTAWENWDVVAGSVDAINGARAQNVDESYGVMLDLDGSNRASGIITTKETFTLQPGEYTFSFEASSSQKGDDNTFRAMVDGFIDETITVSTTQSMQPYTYTFTVSNSTDVQITFDHTLTPGDNEGAYVDNVLLQQGELPGSQLSALFFDDFEQEDGRLTDYTGWQNWNVIGGTVDSHTTDSTRFNHLDPSYGVFMELDGSSKQSGAVTTKDVFTLEPGEYTLSFEAAGANLDGPHTFVAIAEPFLSEVVTVTADQPMQLYTYTFTVTETTEIRLTFDHTDQPGDNRGPVIDNVRLAQGSPADSSDLGDVDGEVFIDSTFETGTESWTVFDGGTGPTQQMVDGEGAICSSDTGNGVYVFEAPPTWAQDLSTLYGGALVYEIRSDPDDTPYEDVDVYLLGENAMIVYDHPTNPSTTSFERIEVPLTAEGGWTTTSGNPVDEAALRSFLANAPTIRIRADYRNAVEQETTCLARVALVLPTADAADSDDQPNNDPGPPPPTTLPDPAANTLSLDVGVEGELVSGESDEWTFQGTAGQTVDVLVNGDTLRGSADTVMEIYGPGGALIAESDDNVVIGGNSLSPGVVGLSLPETGTYTVIVRGYDERAFGPYTLLLRPSE